jgi:hypothetical protein
MRQFLLPFKYEEETKTSGLTSLAGLPLYLDLLHSLNIPGLMRRELDAGVHEGTAWTPGDIVLTLVILNLAGGEHVDDLRILESDAGFCSLMGRINRVGRTKAERRALQKAREQQGCGVFPSRSTVFRFLNGDGEEGLAPRGQGHAYIPESGKTSQLLRNCNQALLSALQCNRPSNTVTLDLDATLIETHKSDSLYGYKGYRAYQPVNVWWDEQQVMLHTQFRDGNVPAGYALKPVLEEAVSCLPLGAGVQGMFLRSDSAAYDIEFLKYCEDMKIRFAIGCRVSQSLRKEIKAIPEAEWKPLDKLREYAELCFVPSSLSTSKSGYEFRYVATREALREQGVLCGSPEKEYPFPVEEMNSLRYKIQAIVTNRDIPAQGLVHWYYKRCGHSEEVHAILKNELAGGVLPSGNFNANAVWWHIAVLSHNIHSIFKLLCCAESWQRVRLKRIRFCVINIAGRVLERGHQLYIRLTYGHPANSLFQSIREAISRLRPCPA